MPRCEEAAAPADGNKKKTVSVPRFVAEKYVSERLPKPFEHIYIIDVEYDFQQETWKGKGILLNTPMSTIY